MKRLISLLLSLTMLGAFFPLSCFAMNAKPFSPGEFEDSTGYKIVYQLYVPDSVSEDAPLPLLIFLHGAGEVGNDNVAHMRTTCGMIDNITSHPDQYPCIVLVPQCPEGIKWANYPVKGNYSTDENPMADSLAAVYELMQKIESEYPVDSSRRYITGLSMGGFGTWDFICRYPRTFAAAIPVCGAGDPMKLNRLLSVSIHSFHGEKDTVIPPDGDRFLAQMMEELGATRFTYTEIKNGEHGIWGDVYKDKDLLDWLMAQKQDEDQLFWGDVDQDNAISPSDALLALQHSVGLTELNYEDAKVADVNLDNAINAADALEILQKSVGILSEFTAES